MNRVTVLNFSPQISGHISFPYIFALFKNYYESYGSKEYQWVNPKYLTQSVDPREVAKYLHSLDLKYLFASLYVWNYSYSHHVLREFRELNNTTVICVGGPHIFPSQEYFEDHPWVDLCCDTLVYGEVFVKDLLDGNLNKDIAGAIWKGGKSTKPFFIRDFKWAPNTYESSLDYALELATEHPRISMQLETSRGCPFKCTFCEWGGGIGTKMNKRSLNEIKNDIDAMVAAGVDTLQICDSNFGFWEEDVEVMRYICEYKTTIGFPKNLEIYGWSKNSIKHHYEILKLLVNAGFTQHYAVSIQSVNPQTLVNVNRSDIPLDKRIEFVRKVRDELDPPIQFEIMLGLPGDTLEDYYTAIDLRHEFKDFISFVWWLLPNTEAHTPEYRKKFGLLTAWADTVENDFSDQRQQVWWENTESWEYVIGSDTLTPTEWLEAFLLDRFYVTAKLDKSAWTALEIHRNKLGLMPKEFWRKLVRTIPLVTQGGWQDIWQELYPKLQQVITPDNKVKSLYMQNLNGKDYTFQEIALEFYERGMEEILNRIEND